jgi:hypothetical protein
MCENNRIECEACGDQVAMARSVRMRIDPNIEMERIVAAFPDLNNIPADRLDDFNRAHIQYERNSQHRRAFICLQCYAKLDNHDGVAPILTKDGEAKTYGLSGRSRRDQAPVYDYAKWLRYQRSKAGEMGVELPPQ